MRSELLVGRDRVVGRHEHVPAGGARLQLGQHLLVRAEDGDIDLDAGLLGELVEILLGAIVRPGGEIHRAGKCGIGLARLEAGHGAAQHGGRQPESGDAEEMAARDRALLVAAQFIDELLRRDDAFVFGHVIFPFCFSCSGCGQYERRFRPPASCSCIADFEAAAAALGLAGREHHEFPEPSCTTRYSVFSPRKMRLRTLTEKCALKPAGNSASLAAISTRSGRTLMMVSLVGPAKKFDLPTKSAT